MSKTGKKRSHKAQHDDATHPRRVGLRRQAAPLLELDMAPDQVDDYQTLFGTFPDLKSIIAYDGHPDGVDGDYGPLFEKVIKLIAEEAHISVADIPKIDFRHKKGALYDTFIAQMNTHHHKDETPQQVVARVDTSAADAAAKAAAAKAAAAAAAAKAAADEAAAKARDLEAQIPAEIRGTAYDPRNIINLTQQQRYDLAVKGLFALDELKSERSTPNLERIYDKMDETVRYANKYLGTKYSPLSEADPLSDEALVALGRRVAAAGGVRAADQSIYRAATGQTQDQLNAAAARGLRALDRTSSGRYDPTDPDNAQRLQHNIRKFEREVMGLNRVEADGIADNAMVAALEKAVRVRGGLTQVTGVESRVAAVGSPLPRGAATDGQDQTPRR